MIVLVIAVVITVALGVGAWVGWRVCESQIRVTANELDIVKVECNVGLAPNMQNRAGFQAAVLAAVRNMAPTIVEKSVITKMPFRDLKGRMRYRVTVYVGEVRKKGATILLPHVKGLP